MHEFIKQTIEDKLRPEEVLKLRKQMERLREKCTKQNVAKGKI